MTGPLLVTVRTIWGAAVGFIHDTTDQTAEQAVMARVLDLAPGFSAPRLDPETGLFTAVGQVWPLTSGAYARVVLGTYTIVPAQLVDAAAAAVAVGRPYATVRRWIADGRLTQYGTDTEGRKLYALQDVHDVAHSITAAGRGRPARQDQ